MAGAGGILYVTLVRADELDGADGPPVAGSNAMFGALQPYEVRSLLLRSINILAEPSHFFPEDALAEVCSHFKVDQKSCYFAQKRRGKSWRIAPSAWRAIQAEEELELVVEAKQSALVVPATPEHTDHSDEEERPDDDEEVSDSDVEGCSAYNRNRFLPGGVGDEEQDTPRQNFLVQRPLSPSTIPPRERRRSISPSPSNGAVRKQLLRRQIKEEEEDLATSSRPRSPTSPPPPARASPTNLAPPPPAQPQSAQPHHPQEYRSPTPPTRSLPADLRFSVETEQSWCVGLNSNGDLAYVQRSPEHLSKGKGRAELSPTPESGAAHRTANAQHDSPVGQAPAGVPASPSARSSASSYAPPPPTTMVKLSSSQPAPFASTSRLRLDHLEEQERAFAAIKAPPSSSQPAAPQPSPAKRKAPAGSSTSVGRSAKRAHFDSSAPSFSLEIPSPSRRSSLPPRTSTGATSSSDPSSASVTTTAAHSRASTSSSSPKKRRLEPLQLHRDREAALARPRFPLPEPRGSQRFKLFLRLPNWPRTEPNARTPLNDVYLRQVKARNGDGFDLTLEHIFEDAELFTEWKREEMRFTFCPGTEKETKVWGFDRELANFRSLREIGCENHQAIDIDWVAYDPRRSVLDED
ncbi:hypothetical protein JCM6882_000508 [Rhodosporidiobolus microsporus]